MNVWETDEACVEAREALHQIWAFGTIGEDFTNALDAYARAVAVAAVRQLHCHGEDAFEKVRSCDGRHKPLCDRCRMLAELGGVDDNS